MARIGDGSVTTYSLNLSSGNATFRKDGTSLGHNARCFALVVQSWDAVAAAWVDVDAWDTANNIDVPRDVQRNVEALATNSPVTDLPGYGFRMEVTPTIGAKSTNLRLRLQNDSKVPYLGDLPIIGWALSSESETTKKAQLVMVMNVTTVVPEQTIPAGSIGDIMKVKAATADAGTMNNYPNYGYDQFLIDGEKKRLDPLP